MRFVVIKELSGCWYWQMRQADGEVIAASPAGFTDRDAAIRSVRMVRANAAGAPIYDPLGNLLCEPD